MTKASLDLNDFTIAARKTAREPNLDTDQADASVTSHEPAAAKQTGASASGRAEQRRQQAEARAIAQEDVRNSLKNLKRSKQRTVKFFVNIALDYDLKARLQRAAQENDVKMTVVVKAALDIYLSKNGY
ncbi:hypothetical protein [Rhizobium sp. Root482]|uniref:hypothetical protein n=1 Tax=Rhizobium sp. Root482 TaxID=1736543 RepID=UPI000AE009C6|nr:hypothetical protein [Rhizobium sp. Root482]